MHVTGEQLGQLSGIAAVLRFPLPELEDDQNDDSDEVGGWVGDLNLGIMLITSELQFGCWLVISFSGYCHITNPWVRLLPTFQQDSLVGEGRDMNTEEEKALAQGVSALDMGL